MITCIPFNPVVGYEYAYSAFGVVAYPARALYDLVNDVASCRSFCPWCSASEVLEVSDTHTRACFQWPGVFKPAFCHRQRWCQASVLP